MWCCGVDVGVVKFCCGVSHLWRAVRSQNNTRARCACAPGVSPAAWMRGYFAACCVSRRPSRAPCVKNRQALPRLLFRCRFRYLTWSEPPRSRTLPHQNLFYHSPMNKGRAAAADGRVSGRSFAPVAKNICKVLPQPPCDSIRRVTPPRDCAQEFASKKQPEHSIHLQRRAAAKTENALCVTAERCRSVTEARPHRWLLFFEQRGRNHTPGCRNALLEPRVPQHGHRLEREFRDAVCVRCGTVLEESTIVASVEFDGGSRSVPGRCRPVRLSASAPNPSGRSARTTGRLEDPSTGKPK